MLLSKGAYVNARGRGITIGIACAAFDGDEDRLAALLNERLKEKICLPELVEFFLNIAAEVKAQDRHPENILRGAVAASNSASESVQSTIQEM